MLIKSKNWLFQITHVSRTFSSRFYIKKSTKWWKKSIVLTWTNYWNLQWSKQAISILILFIHLNLILILRLQNLHKSKSFKILKTKTSKQLFRTKKTKSMRKLRRNKSNVKKTIDNHSRSKYIKLRLVHLSRKNKQDFNKRKNWRANCHMCQKRFEKKYCHDNCWSK